VQIRTRTRATARRRRHPRTMRGSQSFAAVLAYRRSLDPLRTQHKDVNQIHPDATRHGVKAKAPRPPGAATGGRSTALVSKHVKQIDARTRSTARRRKHPRTMRGTRSSAGDPGFCRSLNPLRTQPEDIEQIHKDTTRHARWRPPGQI